MAFTVSDFNDFKQLLLDHPEWQIEVRRLLLSDDFEALPRIVRELAEAQQRADERLDERLAGVEDRLTRLEKVVAELVDVVRQVVLRLDNLEIRVGRIDGITLELDYDRKATGYFARWLKRARPVDLAEVSEQLESHLTEDELDDALLIDLIVRGRVSQLPDRPEAYLTVEVSAVVDEHDIERAARRAELFRRAGYPAIPAVAGRTATSAAQDLAELRGVAMLQDGQKRFWDEALTKWPV